MSFRIKSTEFIYFYFLLLQIVARHNKGGKTLMEKMDEVFGNVKDIAKKSGFRVYISSN